MRAAARGALVEPLLRVAETEQDGLVLAEAVTALGELDYEPATGRVRRLMADHPDYLVRGSAAVALAELVGEDAVDELVQLLVEEDDPHARAAIACALAWLGTDAALPWMEEALGSSDLIVRRFTANQTAFLAPSTNLAALEAMFRQAVEEEEHEVARQELQAALEALTSS